MPACANGAMSPWCCKAGWGAISSCCMRCPIPKMNAVLARVIGRANRPFLQTMILDAGRDDMPSRARR